MELRISKSLKCLSALVFGDVACTLKVVESEDVLKFLVSVYNWATTVFFSVFNLFNEELLNVFWLLVGKKCSQILNSNYINKTRWYLKELKDIVLAEILISISEHFVVDVLKS